MNQSRFNNKPSNLKWILRLYYTTAFFGAFLLFTVQPLIVKYMLPWFGGVSAVWTAATLFFMTALLAGYYYSHLISKLHIKVQSAVQFLTVNSALFLILFRFTGSNHLLSSEPRAFLESSPTFAVLFFLSLSIGVPYFVLSTASVLLQKWLHMIHVAAGSNTDGDKGVSPYRIYAASNAGSFLALAAYPLIIEPKFNITEQGNLWSGSFVLFSAVFILCAAVLIKIAGKGASFSRDKINRSSEDNKPPTLTEILKWVALSALPVLVFVSSTNQLTQAVSSAPVLWLMPLGLYLLSFVFTFGRVNISRVSIEFLSLLFIPVSFLALLLPLHSRELQGLLLQSAGYGAFTFLAGLLCHGELARRKPHPEFITTFYLCVALGGALSGATINFLFPVIFVDYFEYHMALLAVVIVALFNLAKSGSIADKTFPKLKAKYPLLMIGIFMIASSLTVILYRNLNTIYSSRNFYGTLAISRKNDKEGHEILLLRNGAIVHGTQYTGENLIHLPTLYYTEKSGGGLAIENHPQRNNGLKIGVVGLGAGTIAAYCKKENDTVRFYEINPSVVKVAEEFFYYLDFCMERPQIVPGDARIALGRELGEESSGNNFDALILDAFTDDSIPVHLLTKEAMELYLSHTSKSGVIAFHISNQYLDLAPVLARIGDELGVFYINVQSGGIDERGATSNWVLFSRDKALVEHPEVERFKLSIDEAKIRRTRLWTDEYSNILAALK